MKFFAVLMVIALLASIGGVTYLYIDATVTVEATGTIVLEASAQTPVFDSIAAQMRNNAVIGTVFRQEALNNAADYQFAVYTVRLNNKTFLTADMIEVQVTPIESDILQIGDTGAHALSARSTGDIQATILSRAGTPSMREVTVTYYMWGLPFSLKTTCR